MTNVAGLPVLPAGTARVEEGSKLCLRCGLCCQGVIHRGVALEPEDDEVVARLGLPTHETAGGHRALTQPCPCHRGGRCSVYADRPSACRAYECALLERHLRGDVSFEAAVATVEAAKELARSLRAAVEPGGLAPEENVWARLEQLSVSPEAAAPRTGHAAELAVLVRAGALLAHVRRHFQPLRRAGAGEVHATAGVAAAVGPEGAEPARGA